MQIDLTTEDGYDIACALRGPDDTKLSNLKWVFTAAIRNMVGVDTAKSFAGAVRNAPIRDSTARGIRDTLDWAQTEASPQDIGGAQHYLRHVARAAAALKNSNLAALAEKCWRALYRDVIPSTEEIIRLAGDGCLESAGSLAVSGYQGDVDHLSFSVYAGDRARDESAGLKPKHSAKTRQQEDEVEWFGH